MLHEQLECVTDTIIIQGNKADAETGIAIFVAANTIPATPR